MEQPYKAVIAELGLKRTIAKTSKLYALLLSSGNDRMDMVKYTY